MWLPSQTALTTPDGLKEWVTEGVHPTGYEKMVTDYLPKYGHVLYMPPGYPKTTAVIQPALDAIFIGDQTAAEALPPAVADANAMLEKEMSRS